MRALKIPLILVIVFSFTLGIYWGFKMHRQKSLAHLATGFRQVRVLALKGVFSPEFLRSFEDETAIHVQLTEALTPEELWSRIENAPPHGASLFDVVSLFSYQIPLALHRQRLDVLDTKKLSNSTAVASDFRSLPGLNTATKSVPILWGLSGMLVNLNRVPQPPNSWRKAFEDARLKGKIGLLSSSVDLAHILNIADTDAEADAEQEIIADAGGGPQEAESEGDDESEVAQKPAIRLKLVDRRPPGADPLLALKRSLTQTLMIAKVSGDALSPANLFLSSEPPVVVQINHGETAFAPASAKEWRYVLPEEKALLWTYGLSLLTESPAKDEGLSFLNFVLSKESALALTKYVRQASTNRLLEETEIDARLKPSYLRQIPLTSYELAHGHTRALEIRAILQLKGSVTEPPK